jgi:hypothetical protein
MSAPTIPTIVRRPDPQDTKIDLFWYPPSSDGDGSGISSYTLFCSNPSLSQSYGPSDRIASFDSLTNGTSYAFQIYATNSNGLAGPSASFLPVQPGIIPSIPSSISYSTVTSNAILVSWSTPVYTGGADLRNYAVWLYPFDSNTNTILSNLTSETVKVYTYSNTNSRLVYFPNPVSNYSLTVRAINDPGWSVDSRANYINIIYVPPPFTPLAIPGLVQWLDASLSTSFTLSGTTSTITSWLDKSGANNSTTSITGTPLFVPDALNSLGGVSFNGSSRMDIPRVVNDSWSIFVVARTSQAASAAFEWWRGFGVYDMEMFANALDFGTSITAGRWTTGVGSSGAGDRTLNSSTIVNNGSVFLGEFTRNVSGGSSNYVNGFLDSFATSGNTGSKTGTNRMTIGSLQTNVNFFVGQIHEIVAYSTILSDLDRERVEGYLAWKWGFQSNLPDSHIFKLSSPVFTQSTVVITFSPSTLNSLELWLDASDSTTLTLSGTSVTGWSDKSRFTKTTGLSPNKPVLSTNALNSRNTIIFDSNSQNLVSTTLSTAVGTGDISMFAVWKGTATGGAVTGLGGMTGASGTLGLGWNQGGYYNLYDWAANDPRFTAPIGSWVLQVGQRQVGDLFLNLNGNSVPPLSSLTNFTNQAITVGGGPNLFTNGEIAETLFYNRFISIYERQRIEGYLAWKWGLQSNLPNTHPFFYGPPPSSFTEFAPNQLPDLALWLDGANAAGTGKASTDGTMTSWFDRSFLYSTTQTTNTPFFSSSTIFFSTTFLNIPQPAINSTSNYSLFIVTNPHNASNTYMVKQHAGVGTFNILTTSFTTTNLGAPVSGIQNSLYYKAGNPGPVVSSGTTIPLSTLQLLEVHFDSSTITLSSNGIPMINSNGAFGIANNTSATNLTLGTWVRDGTIQAITSRHLMNEFIFYNSTLTQFDRQRIQGYLAWKWGLQSNLPSTHLFRAAAPTVANSSFSLSFSPSSLTSLDLWLDATQLTGLSNGQAMTSWTDRSSNAFANTGVNNPTYQTNALNSLPVVRFNGTNQYFNFGNVLNILSSPGISIFAAVRFNNSNDGSIVNKSLYGGGLGRWGLQRLTVTTANAFTFLVTNSSNTGIAPDATYVDVTSSFRVVSASYDRSTLASYRNGTLQVRSNIAFDSGVLSNTNNLFVGVYNDTDGLAPRANTYFNGDMGEVIVYRSPLTPFERQKVEGYLAWKWGNAHQLDITHPFYFTPPTSSAVFTPLSIPSMRFWFDAQDDSTIVRNLSTVEVWRDKSPNALHMFSTSTAPTYFVSSPVNSYPVLNFSNYAGMSNTTSYSLSATQRLSFFIVLNQTGYATGSGNAEIFADPVAYQYFDLYTQGVNSNIALNIGGATTTQGPTTIIGTNSLLAVTANGSSASVFINASTIFTTAQQNTHPFSASRFYSFGRARFVGNICECICYSNELTLDNRQTVEGYLAWKWGLQGNLPATHPYANENPAILRDPMPYIETNFNSGNDANLVGYASSNLSTNTVTNTGFSYNLRNNNALYKSIFIAARNTMTFCASVFRTGTASYGGILFFRSASACGLGLISNGTTLGYHWNNEGPTYTYNTGYTVPLNTWVHLVLTISPTQARWYVNGSLVSTYNYTHAAVVLRDAYVGVDSGDIGGRTFPGLIDNVALYATTLSPAIISTIYAQTLIS